MRELTHLSLFSGIGGLDLAAEWAGIRTVGQCEWAEYPSKVLEKHWPGIPRWKDIRGLTKESFYERTGRRTVDVVSGGFPCQPFSVAGKQRGKEDDRFLWPEMARVIKELRPAWVVGENVAGIVRMELPNILSELEALGYRARAFLIPACAVGARHRRYRVAIVGYSDGDGQPPAEVEGVHGENSGGEKEGEEEAVKFKGTGRPSSGGDVADAGSVRKGRLPSGKEEEEPVPGGGSKDVQHTDGTGFEKFHNACKPGREGVACRRHNEADVRHPAGKGLPQRGGGPVGRQGKAEPEPKRPSGSASRGEEGHAEPRLGGMADGLPSWVDGYWDIEPGIPRVAAGMPHRAERIKALGNAVVPQQFYPVFKAIVEAEIHKEGGRTYVWTDGNG